MDPEHHIKSGHNSQRRQPEDLVAVLVYIMVSAEAQWRLTERVFCKKKARGYSQRLVGSCVYHPG